MPKQKVVVYATIVYDRLSWEHAVEAYRSIPKPRGRPIVIFPPTKRGGRRYDSFGFLCAALRGCTRVLLVYSWPG